MKVSWEYYVMNHLENFFEWFLVQEILIQVLIVVGLFTVLALVGVLLYYVIKGIAYLIYYLLKGIYHIIRGVCLGIYKIFEGLYYMISSKPKPVKQENDVREEEIPASQKQNIRTKTTVNPVEVKKEVKYVDSEILFCTECGSRFSANMKEHLTSEGIGFCPNCGKQFRVAEGMKSYV
ncbi:MAG: hypothetical protein BAJALOKI2v1_240002 [Promethearchaeota archaeon]|nr:MAG: hypothetical protein BAJALOKI2v1_240002 [Candidatus Lokiarchaeota archaeon]